MILLFEPDVGIAKDFADEDAILAQAHISSQSARSSLCRTVRRVAYSGEHVSTGALL
jgi:hypothetical protein